MLVIVVSLSGCGSITNPITSWLDKQQSKSDLQTFKDAKGKIMSHESAKLWQEAEEAKQEAIEAANDYKNSNWFFKLFKQKGMEKKINKSYETAGAFASNLKNDKIYQENNRSSGELAFDSIKKYLLYIVLGAILLVLLLLLLKKKTRSPEASIPKSEYNIPDVNRTGELKVDYDRLLSDVCGKTGVSVDMALDKFGNSRVAYEKLNLMVCKGMSQSDIKTAIT